MRAITRLLSSTILVISIVVVAVVAVAVAARFDASQRHDAASTSDGPPHGAHFEPERVEMAIAKARVEINALVNRTEATLADEFRATQFHRASLAWHALVGGDERAKRGAAPAQIAAIASAELKR